MRGGSWRSRDSAEGSLSEPEKIDKRFLVDESLARCRDSV